MCVSVTKMCDRRISLRGGNTLMSPRSKSSARRSSRKSTYRPGSPNASLTRATSNRARMGWLLRSKRYHLSAEPAEHRGRLAGRSLGPRPGCTCRTMRQYRHERTAIDVAARSLARPSDDTGEPTHRRTDAQWDAIHALEIELSSANRDQLPEQGARRNAPATTAGEPRPRGGAQYKKPFQKAHKTRPKQNST